MHRLGEYRQPPLAKFLDSAIFRMPEPQLTAFTLVVVGSLVQRQWRILFIRRVKHRFRRDCAFFLPAANSPAKADLAVEQGIWIFQKSRIEP